MKLQYEGVKTSFRSIDEYIAELREVKPLLRLYARDHPNDPKAQAAVAMFDDDCRLLRERMADQVKPDGSFEIGFSQDALKAIQKMGTR